MLSPYDELCAYTLNLRDAEFIHQHVVDAQMAQTANEQTKPIGITFALIGLYLHFEKGFTGKQVQRAHMQLGREKRAWPTFVLPRDRGVMTARDVMAAPPGPTRDRAIDEWARSVWDAYRDSHAIVARIIQENALAPTHR